MCGIAGFVDPAARQSREAVETSLDRMLDALVHRGPDSSGAWYDMGSGVALGHRRLAILDLSPQGSQPMVSDCGRYVIVYNGEIYNFQKIREELGADDHRQPGNGEERGIRWRGHSDTEVILAAIVRWGIEAAITRFVGMFAFALWDRENRALFLARDRMGEKPLYYGLVGNMLVFASELKALRAHPSWRGEIDRGALTLFLRHNYIPSPYSIYQGVYKLSPGTFMEVRLSSLKEGSVQFLPQAYWSMKEVVEHSADNPFQGSLQEAVTQLDGLLKDAVGQQMVADVPLGAFLSGGIDSSTIVAMMQGQSHRPVKTFSIGFDEPRYNEAPYAKMVARHLGTDHSELYVTADQAMAVIPKLPDLFDEPFSDSSQIPTFLVSQLARQDVTVSLSGDGGDELFGGYDRYFLGRRLWASFGWMPKKLKKTTAHALRMLAPEAWDAILRPADRFLPRWVKQRSIGDRLHKLAEIVGGHDPEELYLGLVSHWKRPDSVVVGGYEPPTALTDRGKWAKLSDFTLRMMYLDSVSYLPDDILVKVDRSAMGVSLETRVPFLDHRVVEFAWRLPLAMKVRRSEGKLILREILHRYVPKTLVERPKTGFGVPIDAWLRGPLREWAEALLDENKLRVEGFFDARPIREKWREHLSGTRNWQYYLWDILMFQAWLSAQGASQKVH